MNSQGGWVYLLYGENSFERDVTLGRLKERMRALPAGEHNLTELQGPDITLAAVRAAADAMPFLADRRLVVAHGLIGKLQGRGGAPRRRAKKEAGQAPTPGEALSDLLAYLSLVPDTTSLALVEGAVAADAVAAAIPKGRAFVRAFPAVRDVAGWVRRQARSLAVDLDEGAVRELGLAGGDDLRRLDQELRKLRDYADGRTVTRADVQQLVVARDMLVWALLDGLAGRRAERALAALRTLLAQGEDPSKVLSADVIPLYRRLMIARELASSDRRVRSTFDLGAVGLRPTSLYRAADQALNFDASELERALDLLLATDRQVKRGELEPEVALELAVVQLCTRLAASATTEPRFSTPPASRVPS